MDRAELARYVDHTLLKPEATTADVEAHIAEAADLGVFSVCLSSVDVAGHRSRWPGDCGGRRLPFRQARSSVKAAEAARAIAEGADEIDMVIDIGAAVAGDYAAVEADIAAVRAAMLPDRVLKVIIESAVLSDDGDRGRVPGRGGGGRRLRQDIHRFSPLGRRHGARGGTHGADSRRATWASRRRAECARRRTLWR